MDLVLKDRILIGEGWVMHARPQQVGRRVGLFGKSKSWLDRYLVKNAFRYRMFNLLIPIHEDEALKELSNRSFISLCARDYLDGNEGALKEKIEAFLKSELSYSCDQIWLQTLPRVFGYAFNPISFWYCYQQGNLNAVLCEVNNTFGDRHFYFINRIGESAEAVYLLPKKFHVSPFFEVRGHYSFEFNKNRESSDVKIKLFHEKELKLDTRISLQFRPLKEVTTFYIVKKYKWITGMVIFTIHFQALKLWLKGADFFPRPKPSKERLTYDPSKSQQ